MPRKKISKTKTSTRQRKLSTKTTTTKKKRAKRSHKKKSIVKKIAKKHIHIQQDPKSRDFVASSCHFSHQNYFIPIKSTFPISQNF